jgi:hypothetical protein
MRGSDARTGELFSYVDLEERVPAKHPLRLVRGVVNDVLAALDSDFSKAIPGRGAMDPEEGNGKRSRTGSAMHYSNFLIFDCFQTIWGSH